MATSKNINRGVPNGIYYGYWSGYVCEVMYGGKSYKWEMDEGVRGINCKQIIRVSKGKATANMGESWHTDQIPEIHFKSIKVVAVVDNKITTYEKTVPYSWKYTIDSEYELAIQLGIDQSQIINILTYEE